MEIEEQINRSIAKGCYSDVRDVSCATHYLNNQTEQKVKDWV